MEIKRIPRILHAGGGLRWAPPHDGPKSVRNELQETRFHEQTWLPLVLGVLSPPGCVYGGSLGGRFSK